jgi:hypothetical protein
VAYDRFLAIYNGLLTGDTAAASETEETVEADAIDETA